ncbi:MAG: 3-oxoacyl-ACP synthase, partial [Clostridiales bacterium]|nr:3-oxoacyl-ACP synthase [Clostridiales bacterium]MDY4114097.1 3-oxoacyl-ACP synthase [Roseburia sp.]
MNVKIKGTGSAVPKKCVTNDDLSMLMDTSDEWIRSRTGIESRHLAVEETTTSLATEAAKRALADAGITADELDLIIA